MGAVVRKAIPARPYRQVSGGRYSAPLTYADYVARALAESEETHAALAAARECADWSTLPAWGA